MKQTSAFPHRHFALKGDETGLTKKELFAVLIFNGLITRYSPEESITKSVNLVTKFLKALEENNNE